MGEAVDKARRTSLSQRILKTMGLFGGVQLATIVLSIVRTKFVAVWLGPMGVALNTIFISTQELITSAVGLNLRSSGVRELSAADEAARPRVAGMLLRVGVGLAVIGAVITLMLSPALSLWTLGSTSDWWCFALLAAGAGSAIYLDANLAALQAYGRFKALARVTLASALVCTGVAVPLYYGLRLRAVLPVYLITTIAYMLWALRERRRCCPAPEMPSMRRAWREASPMLRLGMYMTFAAVMERLSAYIFVVYMSNDAAVGDLGIYQAGYTLVNTYVGVVFAALSTEYYPRLASVCTSRLRAQAFVSHEFRVVAMVLMPVVVLFLAVDRIAVSLLYADSFLPMLPYIDVAVCGVVLRAFSFCLAYVILARGDGRVYVVTEAIGVVLGLVLRIAGYRMWGFPGLGWAYVVEYAAYSAVVLWVYRRVYGMRLGRGIPWLCAGATAVGFAALAIKSAIENVI
ncbi:MAG: oligosaccharide flippase family protein [Muribaculaceae bacterium]|nr:oligosaccharide flippase family protein [Muribaculaceae bacterium]